MPELIVKIGDCLQRMREIPSGSVQTCITSPPYFGLRDYGHDEQIGLEETPEQFVAKLVEVFREVRRTLRDDGTLWLNLGDSYAGSGKGRNADGTPAAKIGSKQATSKGTIEGLLAKASTPDLKPKDLIGIPWRVAFALQADGWYLRQDIIWNKPNPMPESVTDRCTKAHEYIFLLSKSPKYYFDADAIKEPATSTDNTSRDRDSGELNKVPGRTRMGGLKSKHYATRNKRSVWTITTKPYKGAHFATFPPELVESCVLAGAREGDTVLDPFGGSGTTAGVALLHGRKAILCELNPEYGTFIQGRIDQIINKGK